MTKRNPANLVPQGSGKYSYTTKTGRPTKYTPKLAEAICSDLAAGKPINAIAADHGLHWDTLYEWRNRPDFSERWDRARQIRAEGMADEAMAIADDSSADFVEFESAHGRIRREPNHEVVQRSRLRVDYRKWLMERWAPKSYGAAQRLELTGAGGGPILLEQITMVAVGRLEADRTINGTESHSDLRPATQLKPPKSLK